MRSHDTDPEFSPGVHVSYAETVPPMKDGLPETKGSFQPSPGGFWRAQVPE